MKLTQKKIQLSVWFTISFSEKKEVKIPVKKSENLDEKVQNLDPDENETDPEHCILDI